MDTENPYTVNIVDVIRRARAAGCRKPYAAIPTYEYDRKLSMRKELEDLRTVILSPGRQAYSILKKLGDFFRYQPERHTLEVSVLTSAPAAEKRTLSEADSKDILRDAGVPVPPQERVAAREEVAAAAQRIGFPLVMKVDSAAIAHKTEAGGVVLNIRDDDAALAAYDRIIASCRAYAPEADISGVLVQKMAEKGAEIILGVTRDPQLGPMLVAGMGGILTELYKDVAISPCPINLQEAQEMLQSLRSYPLLTGYRGGVPRDIKALADLMVTISRYASANREMLCELDINPVFVHEDGNGVQAVDAVMVVQSSQISP